MSNKDVMLWLQFLDIHSSMLGVSIIFVPAIHHRVLVNYFHCHKFVVPAFLDMICKIASFFAAAPFFCWPFIQALKQKDMRKSKAEMKRILFFCFQFYYIFSRIAKNSIVQRLDIKQKMLRLEVKTTLVCFLSSNVTCRQ